MDQGKHFKEWLSLRARLLDEERAFARERLALQRGEGADLETLSIKQSEIRALRALSRAVMRRAMGGNAQRQGGSRDDHGPAA